MRGCRTSGDPGSRRDRFRQEHPAREDLSRRGPGCRRDDRPHAAAPDRRAKRRGPDRRGARRRTRHAGGLPGALPAPHRAQHPHQADDRRHPARRDPGRSGSPRLRHPHHRRGARTDAERRLRPRVPARAGAATPGSPGRRGLGHPGGREAPRVLRRGAGHRGGGPDPPHRDPVPARRGRRRRRGEGRGGARRAARRIGRRARVPVRRARNPGDRGPGEAPRAVGHRALPPPRTDAGGTPAGVVRARGPPPRGARDERRRDLADGARHPLRHRRGHRPGEPVCPPHRRAAIAGGADLAGLGRPAGRAMRAPRSRGVHPALRRRRPRGPAGSSGTRDPAFRPRGGVAAHARARHARRGAVPVHRPARPASRQ